MLIYKKVIPGPTPNNGAYAIIYFKDENLMATTEEKAVNLVINEYDSNDRIINTVYAKKSTNRD